jgi:hypothetical protein
LIAATTCTCCGHHPTAACPLLSPLLPALDGWVVDVCCAMHCVLCHLLSSPQLCCKHTSGTGWTWPARQPQPQLQPVHVVAQLSLAVAVMRRGMTGRCVCLSASGVVPLVVVLLLQEVDLAITADLGTLQRLPAIVGHGEAPAPGVVYAAGPMVSEAGCGCRVTGPEEL